MPSISSVTSGVAGRYAAALFELADEERSLDEIAADALTIRGLLAESADLRRLVASPVIGREEQGLAVTAVLEKAGVSQLTRNFVGVVAKNRRLFALYDMCISYSELLSSRRGEMTAEVTTAQPFNEKQRNELEQALRKAIGSKVALDARVDPALLGGIIVKVGSRMVDASLKTKLQRLELSLKGAA
ncbi:MAG: F0F1 ATP synthase subunit delta [Pseudomonadota bacterium]|nr:F0F1 ATP synthase subunit delta [Pseudomonadota bacterium]